MRRAGPGPRVRAAEVAVVAYPVLSEVVAGGYYVSLLAGEGKVALTTLHRALYKGILAAYRRPDLPFVPHVTVGRHGQLRRCERLARRLEKESRGVRARIDGVGVVEVRDALVRTVAMVPMGKAGRRRAGGRSWAVEEGG